MQIFGGHELFYERELEKDLSMVNLNFTLLMLLARLHWLGMVKMK